MKKEQIESLIEALLIVRDCSSQEWQEADGTRKGATDSEGFRLWFIGESAMQVVRDALEAVGESEGVTR